MVKPSTLAALILGGVAFLGAPAVAVAQATITLTVPDSMADEAGQDPAQFTVTRTADAGTGTSLRVYLQLGGTAQRASDYTTLNLTHVTGDTYYSTIAVSQTSVSVTLTPNLDNLIEGEETITLTVLPWQLAGNEYQVGTPSNGQATIADDVAEVQLTVDDTEAAEAGQDPAGFTVSRSNQGNTAATLRVYVELGGTAQRSADYATSTLAYAGGSTYYVTIPIGQSSIAVTFTPVSDNLIEGEETITYNLLGPQVAGHDYTIGAPNSGGATLTDDVAEVTLTVDDTEAAEAGQDPAGFTVSRSNQGNTAATLRVYVELGGTAQRPADYATSNLAYAGGSTYSMTIPTGQSSIAVTFTPVRDNLIEGEETITYSLLGPQLAGHDYTIGAPNSGAASLTDDVAVVTLTVDDTEAAEAGQDPAGFTVARSNQGNTATSLRVYLQIGGAAQRGADYDLDQVTPIVGDVYYTTIGVGELSRAIVLTPDFDLIEEGNETANFTVLGPQLANHDYFVGVPAQGVITILDFVDGIYKDSFEDLEP